MLPISKCSLNQTSPNAAALKYSWQYIITDCCHNLLPGLLHCLEQQAWFLQQA